MRTLVMSDIHGCYQQMMDLLQQVTYQPEEDQLIVLGDLIDRGPQSKEVVETLMKLKENHPERVKMVMGNHDEMFLDWLEEEDEEQENWYLSQGGIQTIRSFCEGFSPVFKGSEARDIVKKHFSAHLSFLRSFLPFHEDDNYIYVHAGVDLMLADWKKSSEKHLRWERKMFLNHRNETGKWIVFGHTPTYLLYKEQSVAIWEDKEQKKIGIDGGCVFGKLLHCLEITPEGHKGHSVSGNKNR